MGKSAEFVSPTTTIPALVFCATEVARSVCVPPRREEEEKLKIAVVLVRNLARNASVLPPLVAKVAPPGAGKLGEFVEPTTKASCGPARVLKTLVVPAGKSVDAVEPVI